LRIAPVAVDRSMGPNRPTLQESRTARKAAYGPGVCGGLHGWRIVPEATGERFSRNQGKRAQAREIPCPPPIGQQRPQLLVMSGGHTMQLARIAGLWRKITKRQNVVIATDNTSYISQITQVWYGQQRQRYIVYNVSVISGITQAW